MGYLAWTAATGCLLLLMSLSYGWINRAPVSVFGLYLLVGIACGPWVFNILNIDIAAHATLTSRVTEIAMAASLFITGLKIRLPLTSPYWKMGIKLALPGMLLTIGGMMLVAHFMADLSWPLSLALAAILAPTDPVLASLVSINDARDGDQLRIALSSEAGLNDGTALPFLMLALIWHRAGGSISTDEWLSWLSIDLLWALVGGLAIGFLLGRSIGLIATRSRHAQGEVAPSDFVALSLICLSFSLAMAVSASGFLAAFAAGVGLRSAEVSVQKRHPDQKEVEHDLPAEMQVNPHARHALAEHNPIKSVGLVIGDALSFGDTVERIFAAVLVIILGVTLAQHWDMPALVLAFMLFVIIRPLSVLLLTWRSGESLFHRLSLGWLGIRGIGSLNYIAYAYMHGLDSARAGELADIAITIVTFSVLIHGISVTPLLTLRRKREQD
ncbi:sodium/proton antiporter, CPA1 family [Kosakonia radicincitans]|uniref:cation:proton antiporter n=1 Tax=Kosakonia radicincitans TaxID=283686 RepID=UPI0009A8917B|nr:cation:proton antiporter [Kosakonia radicincitans]SKC21536.1 sodium/proton antiporter, CPA1 family [Kosakonia radicincitans]